MAGQAWDRHKQNLRRNGRLLPRLVHAKSLNCEGVILFISAQAVALIDAEKMVQLWRVDTAHSLAVREKTGPYPSNLSHQTTFLPRHSRDEHREALIVKRAFFTHFHTQVRSVSFSPDGKYIASASTVR